MSLITRTYTFTDGTTAYGSQVDSEIANIVNTLNNLDAATQTWDIVKIVNASSTPLIVDNSSGSNSVADFRVNGASKVTVGSGGLLTAAAGITVSGASLTMSGQTIAMGSNKITGLANGTASTDGAAFGQIPVFTDWASYTPTVTGCGTVSSVSFWWRQMGNAIFVKGFFTTGTCTGTGVSITLPQNMNLAKLPNSTTIVGEGLRVLTAAGPTNNAATSLVQIYSDGSTNTIVRCSIQTGSNAITSGGGTTIFANGDSLSCMFDYPI